MAPTDTSDPASWSQAPVDITAHRDGILVLGEHVQFQDDAGRVVTFAIDRTSAATTLVTVRVTGGALTVTPATARALGAALIGIANTAEIVGCLTP